VTAARKNEKAAVEFGDFREIQMTFYGIWDDLSSCDAYDVDIGRNESVDYAGVVLSSSSGQAND
jgi:hypothetical protein